MINSPQRISYFQNPAIQRRKKTNKSHFESGSQRGGTCVSRTANSWPLESLVSHRLRSVPSFINESRVRERESKPRPPALPQTPPTGPPSCPFADEKQLKRRAKNTRRMTNKTKIRGNCNRPLPVPIMIHESAGSCTGAPIVSSGPRRRIGCRRFRWPITSLPTCT